MLTHGSPMATDVGRSKGRNHVFTGSRMSQKAKSIEEKERITALDFLRESRRASLGPEREQDAVESPITSIASHASDTIELPPFTSWPNAVQDLATNVLSAPEVNHGSKLILQPLLCSLPFVEDEPRSDLLSRQDQILHRFRLSSSDTVLYRQTEALVQASPNTRTEVMALAEAARKGARREGSVQGHFCDRHTQLRLPSNAS